MAEQKPEIGSENWVKAQIAAKLPPEERDRPERDEQDYDHNRWNLH